LLLSGGLLLSAYCFLLLSPTWMQITCSLDAVGTLATSDYIWRCEGMPVIQCCCQFCSWALGLPFQLNMWEQNLFATVAIILSDFLAANACLSLSWSWQARYSVGFTSLSVKPLDRVHYVSDTVGACYNTKSA
jgi:hypothetical protein